MAYPDVDIFPQMEGKICDSFEKLFQMIIERKELLLRKLHSLKEEFEKQNTSNRNKIEQLASSKYELERMCQNLRGNQAVVQVEKGIADLEKEIRTVREEIRIPELSYYYSLNKLRECISQFGEIRDRQVRGRVECPDSNRASEIPEPEGPIGKYPDLNTSYQNPNSSYQNPNSSYQNPNSSYQNPNSSYQNPNSSYQNPNSSYQNPNSSYQNPNSSYQNPNSSYQNPNSSFQNPNSSYQNPNSSFQNPNSSFQNPNSSFQNPNSSYQNPNSSYQNPNSSYQNPNSSFQNPNSSYQNPNSSFQNPNSSYQNPNSSYQNPNSSYQNPNSSFQNPNSSFQNPNSSFQNPNSSYQNPNSSFQNPNSSFQNPNSSYQNPNSSFQNPNSSFQNPNSSYQHRNPSYQNPNPSYQNPNSSSQHRNPKYTDPIPTSGMTVPEVPVDHFDEELWTQVKLLAENPQEMDSKMTRKLLCELKIPTLTQLNLLLQLVVSEETNGKDPKDLLQAVKEVSDYDSALRFLNQECEICMESYTANDMIQMFLCPHSVCKDCYCAHFTNAVRNSAIKNWTCPVCSEPDIYQMEDPYYYFGLLSIVIQELCEGNVVRLFHQKVNESKPEFRWCPHCNCGFMGRDDMIKLACPQPECQKVMCYRCKRKWEDEHEGRTCEEFQQWREENDRDILDKGLAAKLVEEGVECPCCKFKYELVRGGCMHFRCSQCPAEFCPGCFQLYKKDNCKKFNSCANKGLHAHHPRNCMYHTRDMDVAEMKELLEKGGFQRDEAPAEPGEGFQPNPPRKRRAKIYKARVPEQHLNAVIDDLKTKEKDDYKERPQGELQIPCQIVEFRDNPDGGYEKENCVRFSLEKDGHAGLCEKHYKEYLCGFITNDGLDPIDVLEVTEDTIFDLWAILKRNEIPFNEKMKGDELKLLIKEKLPLQPMTVAGALQA